MRTFPSTSRRSSVWRRLRLSPVGLTIALIALLVCSGTGAYAYWAVTTSMKMSNAVTAGTLDVDIVWTTSVGGTFDNRGVVNGNVNEWTKTGWFTVTNKTLNTTRSMPYTVKLSATGIVPNPNPLATNLNVAVWLRGANCDSGAPSPTTWNANFTVSGNLTSGASAVWCVKTWVTDRSSLADTSGSVQITPTLTAELKTGTTGSVWAAQKVVSDAPQMTQRIFPALVPTSPWYFLKTSISDKNCTDVESNGGDGSNIIAYPCKSPTAGNQTVRFLPTNTGFMRIMFGHLPSLSLGVSAGSTAAGALVKAQTATATDGSQEWQLQQKRAGVYQVVNRKSGLCLQPDTADTSALPKFKQQPCSALAIQEFTLEARPDFPVLAEFKCTDIGTNAATYSIMFEWIGPLQNPATIEFRQKTGTNAFGAWGNSAAVPVNAVNYPVPTGSNFTGWSRTLTHEIRVLDGAGVTIANGSFNVGRSNGTNYLRCP